MTVHPLSPYWTRFNAGHELGFEEGYERGYDDGYADAMQVCSADLAAMDGEPRDCEADR